MGLRYATAVLACLLIAICGTAHRVHSSQLRLWPLVDYEDTADGWSLDLLGPIFSLRVASTDTEVTLRPLASFSASARERRLTALYPLLNMRWTASRTNVRILGFAAVDRRDASRQGEWRDYVRLPPLLYYRAAASRRPSIAVFPVYADLADVLGQHRIQAAAFPLYLKIEKGPGGPRRVWAPFPFISVSSGESASGAELWPLFGWRTSGGTTSTYALWPLYITHSRKRPDGGSEHALTLGPLYWREDSPTRSSRGYLGFGYTFDSGNGDERWDFPWPLWHLDRGPDLERLSMPPFYVGSRTSTVSAGRALWPLYRWQKQSAGGDGYSRYELLLGLWRWQARTSAAGSASRLHTCFPLFRHRSRGSSSNTAAPALLDALFPTNLHVRRLYAPMWQVLTSRRRNDRTSWKLLWGLLADDGEQLQYPFEWRSGEAPTGEEG